MLHAAGTALWICCWFALLRPHSIRLVLLRLPVRIDQGFLSHSPWLLWKEVQERCGKHVVFLSRQCGSEFQDLFPILFVSDEVSFCSPSCPGTCVNETSLKLTEIYLLSIDIHYCTQCKGWLSSLSGIWAPVFHKIGRDAHHYTNKGDLFFLFICTIGQVTWLHQACFSVCRGQQYQALGVAARITVLWCLKGCT